MDAASTSAGGPPPHRRLRHALHVTGEGLMLVLSLVGVALVVWVEAEGLEPGDPTFRDLAILDAAIIAVFAVEYVYRLAHARDRRAFVRGTWYELPGMIPLYAETLGLAKATRLLRIVRLLRLLRGVDAARRLFRALLAGRRVLRASRMAATFAAAVAVVVLMALTVWLLERRTNQELSSFGDALWWAVVTATTVGYGDITPDTASARLIAGVLMLFGIGLIGTVASSLSVALLAGRGAEQAAHGEPADGAAGDAPARGGAPDALVDALERLAALHARGALTDAEFAAAKQRLLGAGEGPAAGSDAGRADPG